MLCFLFSAASLAQMDAFVPYTSFGQFTEAKPIRFSIMLLYFYVDKDFSYIRSWRDVPSEMINLWQWKHLIIVIYVRDESLVQWLSA